MPNRADLEEWTVADLRDLAADRDVEGRSSMSKADLVDALADDAPAAGQTPQQEAVNEGRTGIDPRLAEAKAATREREAALARPSAVEEPVTVVGAESFAAAKEATRKAEAEQTRSVREGPVEG